MSVEPVTTAESAKGSPVPATSILVADDDRMFRRVLEKWLLNWDYSVTVVEDGEKAWAVMQDENPPTLLLLDWMMPGMDGIELCRSIRSRSLLRYPYILLLTSKDAKQDLLEALDAGADDYLTKPFDVDELKARLLVGKRILKLQEELIHARDDLRYQAMHDALTNIWNRGAILEFLHRELGRAARSGQSLGLLMVDIDHFKKVNDTYGHLVGDLVLRECARRLSQNVRSYDWAGRYGGEEFLIIAGDSTPDNIMKHAERLRSAIADEPIVTPDGPISVTISIGVAVDGPASSVKQESLLHACDTALYRAKERGRNRVEFAG
ncbi:MAG TPA: diguanylate cyclase [Terriglobales bacterium]|nr:diguanylate cyclase [Terriglobales bacterium]